MTPKLDAMKVLFASASIVLFTLSAEAQHGQANPAVNETDVIYRNAERTFESRINAIKWTAGPIEASTPLPSEAGLNLFSESISLPVVNCSDTEYRCIHSWSQTLAIPQGGLKPAQVYSKVGVVFRVEKCLRGDSHQCQVALISATCRYQRSDGTCESTDEHRLRPGARVSYVIYFFYNSDFGITAMGTANKVAASESAMRMIATQSVLVGRYGLLKSIDGD